MNRALGSEPAGNLRRDLTPRFRFRIMFLWTVVLFGGMRWITGHGYADSAALSNYAKVLAVTTGRPVQLENFGLLYPHVPLFLLVPFCFLQPLRTAWSPYIVSVLAGATVLTIFHGRLRRAGYPTIAALALCLLIATHPFFLWAVTTGTNRALGLLAMYLIALGLMRLTHMGDSRAYMAAALALALFFFVDESALYVAGALTLALPFFGDDDIVRQSPLGLYTVIYTPFVFAVLSWMYLNWMFFGDPVAFLRDRQSAFLGALGYARYVPYLIAYGGAFFRSLILLTALAILAFPSMIIASGRAIRRVSLRVRVLFLLMVPVVAGALATNTRYLDHPATILVLGIAGLLIAVTEIPRRERTSVILIAALLGGHAGAWLVMTVLPTSALQEWTAAAAGHTVADRYARERALGRAIRNLDGVMMDDRIAFPAIAERNTGAGLILPFDAQFKLSIITGVLIARYVVVPNPLEPRAGNDAIGTRFPTLYASGDPRYRLMREIPGWRIYERLAQ